MDSDDEMSPSSVSLLVCDKLDSCNELSIWPAASIVMYGPTDVSMLCACVSDGSIVGEVVAFKAPARRSTDDPGSDVGVMIVANDDDAVVYAVRVYIGTEATSGAASEATAIELEVLKYRLADVGEPCTSLDSGSEIVVICREAKFATAGFDMLVGRRTLLS